MARFVVHHRGSNRSGTGGFEGRPPSSGDAIIQAMSTRRTRSNQLSAQTPVDGATACPRLRPGGAEHRALRPRRAAASRAPQFSTLPSPGRPPRHPRPSPSPQSHRVRSRRALDRPLTPQLPVASRDSADLLRPLSTLRCACDKDALPNLGVVRVFEQEPRLPVGDVPSLARIFRGNSRVQSRNVPASPTPGYRFRDAVR